MGYEEKELLQKAKAGDIDSFERLIEGIKVKAYQIALSYLKNEEDAKDALQDSLLKIYRNLNHFNEKARFSTWVYRIVVNTCLDEVKKKQRYRDFIASEYHLFPSEEEGEGVFLEIPDDRNRPEQVLLRQEKKETLLGCLDQLPGHLREAVILRDIQGFSYEEMAEINLQISEYCLSADGVQQQSQAGIKRIIFRSHGTKRR